MDKVVLQTNESTDSSAAAVTDSLDNKLKYMNLNFLDNSDSSCHGEGGQTSISSLQLGKPAPNKILPGNLEQTAEESSNNTKASMNEKSLFEMGFKPTEIEGWENIVQPPKENLYTLLKNMIENHIKPNVQIRIGNVNFNCHMMVLQCYSDFFMNCKNEALIKLPPENITPEAFMMVYEWMLSAKPLVQREGILELFNAANFLKIKGLVNQCWLCLDDDIRFKEDTAFLLYLEARSYGLESLEQLMLTRICKFFLVLVASKQFLELTCKEICTLLSSNSIGVNSEVEIFMAVVRWLSHNWDERQCHMLDVMGCVRFSLMPPWFLVTLNKSTDCIEIERIVANPEIKKLINDGISFTTTQLYYSDNGEEFMQFLERYQLVAPVQRQWIYDKECSYHHKIECPNMQYVTYRSFLEYLEMIQTIGKDYWRKLEMTTEQKKSTQCCIRQNNKNLLCPHSKKSRDKGVQVQCKGSDENFEELDSTSLYSLHETNNINSLQNPKYDFSFIQTNASIGKSVSLVEVHQSNIDKDTMMKTNPENLGSWKSCVNVPTAKVGTSDSGEQESSPKQISPSNDSSNFEKIAKVDSGGSSGVLNSSKQNAYIKESNVLKNKKIIIFGGTDPYMYNKPHCNHEKEQHTSGRDVLFYDVNDNQWKHLTNMPGFRQHHSAVVCKGRIYIIGGTRPATRQGCSEKVIFTNSVWSFDPYSLKWRTEISLPQPRRDFALIAIENKVTHSEKTAGLFVIGGECKNGSALSSTWYYDVDKKVWSAMASLNVSRFGLSAAVVNDEIWIVGGITGLENPADGSSKIPVITDSMEIYNLKHDDDNTGGLWIKASTQLRIPRFFARLCYTRSTGLYIIGGIALNEDNEFTSLSSVDRYDFQSNNWISFAEMKSSRHGHDAATIDDKIFIIGGVSNVEKNTLSTVECFCTETLEWFDDFAHLPKPLSGATVVLVD